MADQWRLSVRESFDGYSRGDEITDPALVADILAGPNEAHVTKHAGDAAPGVDPDFAQKVGGLLTGA